MRFKVIDTKNGKKYAVEEVNLSSSRKVKALDEDCQCEKAMPMDAKTDEEDLKGFSNKELKALKKLAKYADDLVAVFEEGDDKELEKLEKEGKEDKKEAKPEEEPKGKASDDEFGEDEDLGLDEEDDEDGEEVINLDEDEEVVTDSEPTIKDSKKSFGSIETKEAKVDDSENDEIADAWKAYYEKARNKE